MHVCAFLTSILLTKFIYLASMIAMLTIGPVLLIAFGLYEWKLASHPIVPMKFLRNRAVVGAALIGFFDFVSFYLTFSYLYSFVYVVKGW